MLPLKDLSLPHPAQSLGVGGRRKAAETEIEIEKSLDNKGQKWEKLRGLLSFGREGRKLDQGEWVSEGPAPERSMVLLALCSARLELIRSVEHRKATAQGTEHS